jgi:hypothetical protein
MVLSVDEQALPGPFALSPFTAMRNKNAGSALKKRS